MYALRKSFGAYSAGTRVERAEIDGDVSYAIFNKRIQNSVVGVAVPADLVVQRRSMTRYVPAINSRERRRREKAAKRALGIVS